MRDYDKTNTITIWFKTPDQNPASPDIKVEINDNGNEVEYALWKPKPGANPGSPPYSGKVEHKTSDKAGYSQQTPAVAEFVDEQMPF